MTRKNFAVALSLKNRLNYTKTKYKIQTVQTTTQTLNRMMGEHNQHRQKENIAQNPKDTKQTTVPLT